MVAWRFIPLLEASGRLQMAIATWLLEQHRSGFHPPALRFYTWSPIAISLGYHQHRYPEFWQTLTWHGEAIELVRRPSGGRAVLHQGDLTYAIVTSGLSSNRMQAYQQICEFLIQGWQQLGIELQYGQAGRNYIHNPNCFGTATAADLVTPEGAKLIGSAQLRRDHVILQHGSIRLNPSVELFSQVFDEEILNLPKLDVSIHTVMNTLFNAAMNCFDAEFEIKPLTEIEMQSIIEKLR